MQAFWEELRKTFGNYPTVSFFFFELMIILARCGDSLLLLDILVGQFTSLFHTFLRMSFHVVGPGGNFCPQPGNCLTVLAEVKDANNFRFFSTICCLFCTIVVCTSKYFWSNRGVGSSRATCFINFAPHEVVFAPILISSTHTERKKPF